MNHLTRKAIVCSTALASVLFLMMGLGFSRSEAAEENAPDIRFGEIRFQIRELASAPSLPKMLEIHIEIFNRSGKLEAPPNSIKVMLVPIETKYPEGASGAKFNPGQQETTIPVPLPPATGRVLTFGLSLPEKTPESMTFDIQINPPEGEKKTVTYSFPQS